MGSDEVWNSLLDFSDDRLAKFRSLSLHTPSERLSIDEAAKLAKTYILACDSEEGRTIDSYMAPIIGGHIHIAKITPQDGFSWIRPPASEQGERRLKSEQY